MNRGIRPGVHLLDNALASAIIDESFDLLERVGMYVENPAALELLRDAGGEAAGVSPRLTIPRQLVEEALSTAPHDILLFDASGRSCHRVGGDEVHFNPGSAALRIFDHAAQSEREATTADLVNFSSLVQNLEHFHFQSTGLISSDVPAEIADCYRLFVGLHYCSKPIVTGTFVVEGFGPMYEMLKVIRGGARELRERPMAIFDACPSPPLKWTNLTAQSVIDCARAGIPSEFVAMPLTGATSPATITGALVQHTAENLAGLAISQLASPGAPAIFGGSPASFDMRTGNPPMGAMETMMIDMAYSQIGKALNLPTHAYMGLSDSKCVDAQAGFETGIGAVLAALAGINVVSGGGMMDFESCQSLEKLVIDNEIACMAYRLIEGIRQREQPMALDVFTELAGGTDFLTLDNTLRWFRIEHSFPRIIDRGNHQQWADAGKPTLGDRASREVGRLLSQKVARSVEKDMSDQLIAIMESHARQYGMEKLPAMG
jgi:trimethylamine--corrinoid protein Co-methyltransferase